MPAPPADQPDALVTSLRNIQGMRFLHTLAAAFQAAGIDLMALKGAALQLTLYDRPHQRPMTDLDLMIRPADVERAIQLLCRSGCRYGEPLVREDFFPRYHHEREFNAGAIAPQRIDLHVRPFRPLRYARLVPEEAFWERAVPVALGEVCLRVPCPEDMLIHLAVHSAVHGNGRGLWLEDIRRWCLRYGPVMDWQKFVQTCEAWHLSLPAVRALRAACRPGDPWPAPAVLAALEGHRASWRDRLVLRQAPRDGRSPFSHLLVDALCTPGQRFVAGYLWAAAVPDRTHMADWYGRQHRFWPVAAHALRILSPLLRLLWPGFDRWRQKVQILPSRIHGSGVFATCDLPAEAVIAAYMPRPVDGPGRYVGFARTENGRIRYYEITGRLRFLNHSCRPNARLDGPRLVALRPIPAGREITIDYGPHACSCRQMRIIAPAGTQAEACEVPSRAPENLGLEGTAGLQPVDSCRGRKAGHCVPTVGRRPGKRMLPRAVLVVLGALLIPARSDSSGVTARPAMDDLSSDGAVVGRCLQENPWGRRTWMKEDSASHGNGMVADRGWWHVPGE